MKRIILLSLVLMGSCKSNGVQSVSKLSVAERDKLNLVFTSDIERLDVNGKHVVAADSTVTEEVNVSYSGLVSLAATADLLVPAIVVTRVTKDYLRQEKYLLSSFELDAAGKAFTRVTFTKINMPSDTDTRTLTFSTQRNNWIEETHVAKNSRDAKTSNVVLDDSETAQVADLFIKLQKRLEKI